MDFQNVLTKLLGNNKTIDEVHVDYRVIDEIVKIAINADPKEYVALLSGDIEENILKITGLIFLPFKASGSSAVMEVFMMPMTTKAVGSVHSHPGPSAQPSQADLTFFGKNGYFHMIICRPYSESTIKAYDAFGNPMNFYVKELSDDIEIKQWEDLGLDEELFDKDFIEESKNDETIINETEIEKEENNIGEDIKLSQNENNQTQNDPQQKSHATLNLEFEIKGKKVLKEIPLPPEYEPGDQVDVDIRTDKTPNDDIDEIIVNVRKAPKATKKNNKVITVTPQKISSKKVDNNQTKEASIEKPVKTGNIQTDVKNGKTSEEIENEIKQMEADIARLKEENERLKKNL